MLAILNFLKSRLWYLNLHWFPLSARIQLKVLILNHVGRGGALFETMTFNLRVVGSTPALAATYTDLGQVLYLQLPVRLGVKLRRSRPIRAVVGSDSE